MTTPYESEHQRNQHSTGYSHNRIMHSHSSSSTVAVVLNLFCGATTYFNDCRPGKPILNTPKSPSEMSCGENRCNDTHLHSGVLGDDASAGAGGVQQGSVDAVGAHHLGQVAAVVVGHDGVCDAHALQVALDGLEAQRVDLVGEHDAAVAHQRSDVCGLATWAPV